MPSPYGREHETEQDQIVDASEESEEKEMEWGYTGGETRFQLICRVYSMNTLTLGISTFQVISKGTHFEKITRCYLEE